MPFTKFRLSCLAVAIGQMVAPSGLLAATINVDATCTLAQAVETANSDLAVGDCEIGANADTIELPQNEIITLSAVGVNGLPVITSEITFNGNGSTIERADDNPNNFRLIEIESSSAIVTMNSLTLTGGRALSASFPNFHGGAIYLHQSATLIGQDLQINDNIAMSGSGTGGNGGAIYAEHSTVSLADSTVDGNSSYGSGGGVGGAYSSITLVNSTISDNFARGGGGGINTTAGTLSGTSLTVSGNTVGTVTTSTRGGGIKVFYQASLSLVDSTIQNNTSTKEGGGISIRAKVKFNISNTLISLNSAEDGGAGLHIETIDDEFSSAALDNVVVDSNTVGEPSGSSRNGGGIEVVGAVLTATNLTITNNAALGSRAYGGGLHASDGASITVFGGTISGNSANFSTSAPTSAGGGGVSLDAASLVADNLNIVANTTIGGSPRGAGVLALGSSLELTSSSVSGNIGTGSTALGAGIYIGDTTAMLNSTLILTDTTLDSNMASGTLSGFGRGVAVGPKTTSVIDRSTISNNQASGTTSQAGGLFVSCGNPIATVFACSTSLSNSTISGNSADTGGGVSVYEEGFLESFNTTFYANQATLNGSQIATYGLPTVDLSNTLVGSSSISACYNTQMGFSFNANANNWLSDASCDGSADGDPKVMPLADNGGFTFTHLPMSGSDIAKMGAPLVCTSAPIDGLDQLGKLRDEPCSIGSVEVPKEGQFFVVPLDNGKAVIFGL